MGYLRMSFTPTQLSLRTARHDWRGGLALFAGAFLCAALLTGAFATGHGIRQTLAANLERRLGPVTHFLYTGDRLPHGALSQGSPAEGMSAHILLPGSIAASDGSKRANGIQVLTSEAASALPKDGLLINDVLARASGLVVGDEVVVRVVNPGALPREAIFSTEEDQTVAVRGRVAGIATNGLHRFTLRADLGEPRTVFVPHAVLQAALQVPGGANLLLATTDHATLATRPSLGDFSLGLSTNGLELITSRIFLPPEVEAAADRTGAVSAKILTYFATALKSGTNACPYSTVCAIEQVGADKPFLPADLKPGQIVINDWLAADLQAKPGDPLTVEYLTMGPQRTFLRQAKTFTIHSVVRMEGLAADRSLMPEFPGMADAENCRDWKAGLPVDFGKVRGKDEDYWDAHKGTPKAFIRLDEGRALWASDSGALTAIRFDPAKKSRAVLEGDLVAAMPPEQFGLTWIDARKQAEAAVAQGMDFGGLFAGMSFFLILACLALAGMFAGWQIEERRPQIALLRSLGFAPKRVRGLLLRESAVFILLGALAGPLVGRAYAGWLCGKIGSEWSGAVQGLTEAITPVGGVGEGFAVTAVLMLLAAWNRLRRATRGDIRELLAPSPETGTRAARWPLAVGVGAVAAAISLAFEVRSAPAAQQPALLFGAGALTLMGGLFLFRAALRPTASLLASLGSLALSNLRRSGTKGTITSGVLAAGLFMVGSAGAFRQDAGRDSDMPGGGTGGFAWVLDATVPVLKNLNDPRQQEELGLEDLGLRVAAFRVQAGDEASCLNLMRAQKPRILGVDPAALSNRFTFVSTQVPSAPWTALDAELPDGEIPALADQNSLMWALQRKVGDAVEVTAEDGRVVRLRLVGAVNNTLLQGALIVSDARFRALYPSTSGHRWFLADGPAGLREPVEKSLREWGVEAMPAVERLRRFHAVQNTYIDIFQVLGGLGVALGALGLAAVTLRNLSRRRRELAVMQAQGFTPARLRALAWREHGLLLAGGLAIGFLAACFSILPAGASLVQLAGWAALMLAIGGLGIAFALRTALRGTVIGRLREEN